MLNSQDIHLWYSTMLSLYNLGHTSPLLNWQFTHIIRNLQKNNAAKLFFISYLFYTQKLFCFEEFDFEFNTQFFNIFSEEPPSNSLDNFLITLIRSMLVSDGVFSQKYMEILISEMERPQMFELLPLPIVESFLKRCITVSDGDSAQNTSLMNLVIKTLEKPFAPIHLKTHVNILMIAFKLKITNNSFCTLWNNVKQEIDSIHQINLSLFSLLTEFYHFMQTDFLANYMNYENYNSLFQMVFDVHNRIGLELDMLSSEDFLRSKHIQILPPILIELLQNLPAMKERADPVLENLEKLFESPFYQRTLNKGFLHRFTPNKEQRNDKTEKFIKLLESHPNSKTMILKLQDLV